jgi:UDP-N-acetylglucosamine--N-acetylmuramyl-(pentapeptide) pyrophosphoryl-undecaprenol N-acetylglucosamine transferase
MRRSSMPEAQTILLAGGGTGGHLYPGIAAALALKEIKPDVRPVFLCTTREIDRIILEPTGFEFVPQPIVPPVRTVSGLLKFWKSWRETKDLVRQTIRKHRPAAVLGLGGYAAGVAVRYAAHKKIPTAIVNPDVIPGKANQYLMKHVEAVCCQFDETRAHVHPSLHPKLKITGCPIRPEFAHLPDRADACHRLGLHPSLLTLVITGASQGAQTINEAILQVLPEIKRQGWQILHLAGRDHAKTVENVYRQRAMEARVIDFTPDMADVWSAADLAVSRSGASTCAELTACGVPSILMPYPFHKDLHQRANAKVLADANAAVLLDDEKDAAKNAALLKPLLESLLYDADKRTLMARAAKSIGKPDAAAAVAGIVREVGGL